MLISAGQRTTEKARVNSVNSLSGISHYKMKLKKDNISCFMKEQYSKGNAV